MVAELLSNLRHPAATTYTPYETTYIHRQKHLAAFRKRIALRNLPEGYRQLPRRQQPRPRCRFAATPRTRLFRIFRGGTDSQYPYRNRIR